MVRVENGAVAGGEGDQGNQGKGIDFNLNNKQIGTHVIKNP